MKHFNRDVDLVNIAIFFIILGIIMLCAPAWAMEPFPGRVVKVSDGDTLKVKVGHDIVTIRVAEVDAPERLQAWGFQATRLVKKLCYRKMVAVHPINKDRYGRYVARIILTDGRNLSEVLVKAGLAWHYKAYSKNKRLEELEAEARAARRGVWGSPVPPWEWRKRKGGK